MVVLHDLHLVGEAEGHRKLHLVLRLVCPVPAPPLGLPEDGGGEGVLPGQLGHIVHDAVVVDVAYGFDYLIPLCRGNVQSLCRVQAQSVVGDEGFFGSKVTYVYRFEISVYAVL